MSFLTNKKFKKPKLNDHNDKCLISQILAVALRTRKIVFFLF